MKLCILINAHKNLDQINGLIESLVHKNVIIFVHIDKKSTINIYDINKKAIILKNRTNIKWGRFSQVQSTLTSMNEILNCGECFDYLAFISGQDYPIIHCSEMLDYFASNSNKEFIECSSMDSTWETSSN